MRQMTVSSKADAFVCEPTAANLLAVGPVRRWEILISVWDRYQRFQMLDQDTMFCSIADSLRDYERPDVSIRTIIHDRAHHRISPTVFIDPASLQALLAGCAELVQMIDSDVAGAFRYQSVNPLLSADEERTVRQAIRDVERVAAVR